MKMDPLSDSCGEPIFYDTGTPDICARCNAAIDHSDRDTIARVAIGISDVGIDRWFSRIELSMYRAVGTDVDHIGVMSQLCQSILWHAVMASSNQVQRLA